eukprot:gnl/TRDRNA2_/TRDRNA2_176273_c2_seq1.p2 gnl/TRDRNA2_/TRDRNA2_176273_c2~~gnl/TRDRNA2_/TRDRNA2_176273_c2_seq1.p2  ORF type:complete len:100 (-),score=7.60 gnl/TRDRNA2_/TRDRNA2_176273_c2_seq1:31-330(-)
MGVASFGKAGVKLAGMRGLRMETKVCWRQQSRCWRISQSWTTSMPSLQWTMQMTLRVETVTRDELTEMGDQHATNEVAAQLDHGDPLTPLKISLSAVKC